MNQNEITPINSTEMIFETRQQVKDYTGFSDRIVDWIWNRLKENRITDKDVRLLVATVHINVNTYHELYKPGSILNLIRIPKLNKKAEK